MPITKLNPTEAQEAIAEWQSAVSAVLQQVREWIAEDRPKWQIETSSADVTEESSGRYTIPVLEIIAANGRLILEPVGRDVYGAKGRIDLYAYPSLYRVMLLRNDDAGEWVMRTGSGIDWPQPWGKEGFLAVADRLLDAA